MASGSRLRRILTCLRRPGVQAVVWFRMAQWLRRQPLIVKLLLKPFLGYEGYRIRRNWGINIDPLAQIGPGFYIAHYGGIFIGGDVVAGSGLMIMHNVTLGYCTTRSIQGCPVIGDNVFIAPGAKVVGRIRIGNNVRIGPNAVLQRSVPDNAVVQIRPVLVVTWPDQLVEEVSTHLMYAGASRQSTAA